VNAILFPIILNDILFFLDSDCLFSEKYLKLNILNGAKQIVCCQIFQITHLTFRKDISFECDAVLDRITFQLWIDFANGKLPALLIPNHFDIDSTKFYRGYQFYLHVLIYYLTLYT
jgi:hypothetical protein